MTNLMNPTSLENQVADLDDLAKHATRHISFSDTAGLYIVKNNQGKIIGAYDTYRKARNAR